MISFASAHKRKLNFLYRFSGSQRCSQTRAAPPHVSARISRDGRAHSEEALRQTGGSVPCSRALGWNWWFLLTKPNLTCGLLFIYSLFSQEGPIEIAKSTFGSLGVYISNFKFKAYMYLCIHHNDWFTQLLRDPAPIPVRFCGCEQESFRIPLAQSIVVTILGILTLINISHTMWTHVWYNIEGIQP